VPNTQITKGLSANIRLEAKKKTLASKRPVHKNAKGLLATKSLEANKPLTNNESIEVAKN